MDSTLFFVIFQFSIKPRTTRNSQLFFYRGPNFDISPVHRDPYKEKEFGGDTHGRLQGLEHNKSHKRISLSWLKWIKNGFKSYSLVTRSYSRFEVICVIEGMPLFSSYLWIIRWSGYFMI